MIKLMLKTIVSWLTSLFTKEKLYKAKFVDEMPKTFVPHTVYVLGNTKNQYLATILCPCGCKESLNMNLTPTAKPRWKLKFSNDKTVSFHPSLWKKSGCKSHFFLRDGKINWV